MPIYDQSYQHWQGEFRPMRFRWLPMVRYHLAQHMKRKLIWFLLFLSFVPSMGLVFGIYGISAEFNARQEIEATRGFSTRPDTDQFITTTIARRIGLDYDFEGKTRDERYRELTRVGFVAFLLTFQSFFVLVMSSAVGAGLIARDIQSNALEIYLTKPISAVDYVLGKLAVITFFVFLVTFFPSLVLFLVTTALWDGYFTVAWPYVVLLFGTCLLASIVNGIVILGLSSLAKSSRYASVIWFAMCFLGFAAATTLFSLTQEPIYHLISYRSVWAMVFNEMFGGGLERLVIGADDSVPVAFPVVVLVGYTLASLAILRSTIRAAENR